MVESWITTFWNGHLFYEVWRPETLWKVLIIRNGIFLGYKNFIVSPRFLGKSYDLHYLWHFWDCCFFLAHRTLLVSVECQSVTMVSVEPVQTVFVVYGVQLHSEITSFESTPFPLEVFHWSKGAAVRIS